MTVIQTFVSSIIQIITLFFGEEFLSTVMLAPFVFFVIRQIVVIFRLMLAGVRKT